VTTSSTQLFVSELIRAANEVSKLTRDETVRLLQRAAATLRDYGGHDHLVFELTVMAASIDFFSPQKVSAMLLEAAEVIKAARGTA
jgi:hypothetical protein